MKNYPRKFFDDLAFKFTILEWQVCPGYTPIFSKNQYKKDGFIKRLFFKLIKYAPPRLLHYQNQLFKLLC